MSLSGGMDSTSVLIRLINEGYKIDCLSFNYGQKHVIEIEKAIENIAYLSRKGYQIKHQIIDLTSAMSIFHSSLTDEDSSENSCTVTQKLCADKTITGMPCVGLD